MSRQRELTDKYGLNKDYKVEQPSDSVKKINFYTSTCFEGCDIYDPDGVTVIVSDGRKANTLLDISTLFTQICGRIRDSRYKHEIIHVFSTTKYSQDISLDEFVAATEGQWQKAVKFVSDINAVKEDSRIKILSKISYFDEPYIRKEDNRLVADRNLVNMDIVNFKLCRHIYASYVNLADELQQNGYKVIPQPYSYITEKKVAEPKARISFEELFIEYHRLKTTAVFFTFENKEQKCVQIAAKSPLVKEAYDKLGADRVKELRYHVGNIRREIAKRQTAPLGHKIVRLLNSVFPKLKPIEKSRAKAELQRIYNDLGIRQTAKATDLERWFEIKESSPKIKGKTTACVTLIREKFIVR